MICNTRSICKTTFVEEGGPGKWENFNSDEWDGGGETSDGGIVDEDPCVVQPGTTSITWQEPSGVTHVLNPCDESAWEADKIVNNLNNPCLSNTLLELTENNYSSTIGQMLNTIWGVSANCDIVFYETDTLDYFKDAKTNTTTQGGIIRSEIRLNATVLPQASREYVAATMFHETLHASLNLNGSFGNLINHNVMATNQYVNMLVNTLMAKFPTLELQDAKALAWGGLQDTDAWKLDIKVNNPTLYDDLRIRNSQHRVKTKGTSCQ